MRSLKTTVLLILVASFVPTLMVAWLTVSDTRNVLRLDAEEVAKQHVSELRMKAETLLAEPARAIGRLSQFEEFWELSSAQRLAYLAAVVRLHSELTAVTVFSPQGSPLPGLQVLADAKAKMALHEVQGGKLAKQSLGLSYSEPYPAAQGLAMTIAAPIGDGSRGFLAAEISLSRLGLLLSKQPGTAEGRASVVDEKGSLVAAERMVPGEGEGEMVIASEIIPVLGWTVIWKQPIASAYKKIDSLRRRAFWSIGIAVLAALGLALVFARQLTSPLRQFSNAALEIARGHFGARVEIKGKSELADVAQMFNYMSSALQAYDSETKGLYESVEKGYLETIVALAHAIDSKDTYTRGHSQRVGDLSVEIGRELGFTDRQLRQLQYGGILHDVGKIGIAEGILRKGSKLTAEEMTIMRSHPVLGEAIIEPVGFLVPIRAAARNHHERWDGAGYPDGLKGEQIPLIARIVTCADTFDACTSTRPYSKALPLSRAMEIVESLRGNQLDPKVVDAFCRVIAKKGVRLEGEPHPVKVAV